VSWRRTLEVVRLDLAHNVKRPIFWILIVLLALTAWGLTTGNVQVNSGNSDVGGAKMHWTSQFGVAKQLPVLVFIYYLFFVAIASGLVVIRDEELKVGDLLHSSSLKVGEYIWGKFAAVLISFLGVLALQLCLHAFFFHVAAGAKSAEYVGPFSAWNYLWPALVFAVPAIVFLSGTTFALGAITRRPILVFSLPIAALLICAFFLWSWSPTWLDPRINELLMWTDPAGQRWLDETWMKIDRGVEFYNAQPIALDPAFALSRIAFIAIGLLAVFASQKHFAATLRGSAKPSERSSRAKHAPAATASATAAPLALPRMSMARTSLVSQVLEVARIELRELKSQAGLYLFAPLIVLEILEAGLFQVGAFDTPLLATPGTLAANTMGMVTVLMCLLLLFYTVESLERERSKGLAAIYYATPVRSAAILFGKTLANSFVGIVILIAALAACWVVVLWQGKVSFSVAPFLIVWGGLIVPTFFLWCAFTTAVFALTRNRYGTYSLCLVALIFSGYMQIKGHMNWVGNWPLWGAVTWTDMGPLELWTKQLVLNRAFALALGVLFIALAVRFFPRRSLDASSTLQRLQPMSFFRGVRRLSPYLAAPLVLGIWLYADVQAGFQGDAMDKKAKDYWRKNIGTWRDAPLPAISNVKLDLELDPARRWFKADGEYTLVNDRAEPLRQIPVTPGVHFENVEWLLDGEKVEPENRAGLCVFTPAHPLAPGATMRLGFRHDGKLPPGATENGGGVDEFILSSGVVLTSFTPSFVPMLGYIEAVGVDEDNKSDAKEYADDFYVGQTDSAFGNNVPCTTHVRVTAPAEYTVNSVGTLTSDEVADGKRTVVWESDHPVSFFNVVAGRWAVKRGNGTVIYYHPEHDYNLDEMLSALDNARRWYSEWFYPFPWNELKLSEFAGYTSYAQGFPTNITFSESIGFLTESEPKVELAFRVTAHEAAHQWWGNILVPGKGPGGNILSEGMSHFSTVLLIDQVKGLRSRIEFLKAIEDHYGDRRQVDSERPLVKLDGTRDGDESVTYDKGGWVFWMLLNEMGRDSALAGCRDFIRRYETGPDHPVLQDFVAVMREHAADTAGFDAFVEQWFFHVVMPEYQLTDAKKSRVEGSADSDLWEVHVNVKNIGTGRMPIDVAAVRGERFPEDATPRSHSTDDGTNVVSAAEKSAQEAEEHELEPAAKRDPEKAWMESRATITLGAGESQQVVIRCPFEPESVLIDPDALVLQLRRKSATAKL
jgi:ABC-type transport system involved in multi-copper enzyme maturation permease subunit